MASNSVQSDISLTFKQKQFLLKYFEYGNGTKAALEVYDTNDPGAASVIASENLAKLKNPIRIMMEKRGLDMNRLLDVLDEGLSANRVVSAVIVGKEANEKTNDFIEVPDHAVRHKYLETAGKWLDIVPEKDTINAIQVNISPILGGQSLSSNNSNQKAIEIKEEN